jgi:hypothetical protein
MPKVHRLAEPCTLPLGLAALAGPWQRGKNTDVPSVWGKTGAPGESLSRLAHVIQATKACGAGLPVLVAASGAARALAWDGCSGAPWWLSH